MQQLENHGRKKSETQQQNSCCTQSLSLSIERYVCIYEKRTLSTNKNVGHIFSFYYDYVITCIIMLLLFSYRDL